MTDKEIIKKEVERLNKLVPYDWGDRHNDGLHDAYFKIIQFIDSMPEEPISEELIEELKKIVNIRECVSQGIPVIKIAYHFAQWQKEQMMKDAINGRVSKVILHKNGDEVHYAVTYPIGKRPHNIKDDIKLIIL